MFSSESIFYKKPISLKIILTFYASSDFLLLFRRLETRNDTKGLNEV